MDSDSDKHWSLEQADRLQHEAFVNEVLRLRSSGGGDREIKSRARWFLESTGGTAMITVLLGGLIGSGITAMIQSSAKDREFEQAWVKARGDQALVAYKDYLEQQRETMKRSYDLIGTCVSASDDLIELTGPDFDLQKYPSARPQRTELRKSYNVCDAQWRGQREALGLLMTYYHHGQPKVLGAWNNVKDSVTKYMNCAADWYLQNNTKVTDTSGACKMERQALDGRLGDLSKAADEARHYAWEGWESPDSLRSQTKPK